MTSLYVRDGRTARVLALLGQTTRHFVSVLTFVEVVSGMARACRSNRLRPAQFRRARDAFRQLQPYLIELELTPDVVGIAQELVEETTLKASDALQLATFERLFRGHAPDAEMVCGDRKIIEIGLMRGLPVLDVQ